MRVVIVPEDKFVSVDGEGYRDIDLSFLGASVHAIQWYGTDGEIEYKDARGRATENRPIDSLEPYQPALDAWQAAKDAAEAQSAEMLAEPTQTPPSEG
jgi:hypothetical protein